MRIPFDYAVVRFACFQPKAVNAPLRLVFASVELLPPGRAQPEDAPLDAAGHPPSLRTKNGRVFFRRLGMAVAAALDWYRSPETLPDRTGSHAGKPLKTGDLADEPGWGDELWQALTLPDPSPPFPSTSQDDRIDPFSGANREVIRVHRRLSAGDADVEALGQEAGVMEWLRRRVWVDFGLYPELLGSAALVVPDPEVRKASMRLDRNAEGTETVVFEVETRGVPACDLRAVLTESRYGGIVWQQEFDVPDDGIVVVPRPQPVVSMRYELTHPERGLIAAQPFTNFIRSMTGEMAFAGREISVRSKDGRGKKALETTRSVQEVSREKRSVGTPLIAPGRVNHGRERRRFERGKGAEFWFDDPTAARDKLWAMIGSARNDVLLVDPYADGQDLWDYGMASSGAGVRLLTAAKKADDTREATSLERALRLTRDSGKTVEARVMSKKALHDRFIMLDHVVWSLGASLNGVGGEATMLICLREPQPIYEKLEGLWAGAHIIEVDE